MKPLENTVKTHKDYYTYMSKFGKWTDKIFTKNINQIFTEQRLSKKILNRVRLTYLKLTSKGHLPAFCSYRR